MTNASMDFAAHFLQSEEQLSATTFSEDNNPSNDIRDVFYSVICMYQFMFTTFQNIISPNNWTAHQIPTYRNRGYSTKTSSTDQK